MSRAALLTLTLTLSLTAPLAANDPLQLSDSERTLVRDLARKELEVRALWKGKVYLTRVEVFLDSSTAPARRLAVATHYRYEGDLAILTSIDLARGTVTGVESVPHLPTSLAPEELAEAERLARADPEVARALARYAGTRIEVGAQVSLTADPKAPGYRHRVVRLSFRQGREYLLYAPGALVDLTAGTVRLERVGKPHP